MKQIPLESKLTEYLSLRDALGFQTRRNQTILEDLVEHLSKQHLGTNIRAQIVIDWACNSSSKSGIAGQFARLVIARGFLIYLKSIYPNIEIPDTKLIASPRRSTPYVFSNAELLKILIATEALKIRTRLSIEPRTAQTLFALIACTGLRQGEARRLTIRDLHLDANPPHLLIRCSKFYKSRLVPLHASAANHLREHLKWRQNLQYASASDTLFASRSGQQIKYQPLRRLFLRVIQSVEICPQAGQLPPSLHSLRHTFAVQRVTRWYQDGMDARGLMPNLSIYLGHTQVEGTYWYLSATPELMDSAARRFERYANRGGLK